MKLLILTPIAERDVHFYLATAERLKAQENLKIIFLSFYQPGNDLIRQKGYEVLDPYQNLQSPPANWSIEKLEKEYQTPPLKDLILHEKLTFGISNDEKVLQKFAQLFYAIEALLEGAENRYPTEEKHILQELAGFVGPLSLFYVGIKRGWTNWMTEPAFYKGRIHLLKNNLYFKVPMLPASQETTASVHSYLKKALEQKTVVAAVKDAHHYKDMGIGKVFNLTNFQKLSKKIYFKYVKGEKQEFEHIWNHVQRYLMMLKNRMKNDQFYCSLAQLPSDQAIFFFPFHVQLDFSLTIRSPRWLDQLGLIEELLKYLPNNAVLVAKEHPASIGCLDQDRLEKVLKNPQFRLMHPQINSYDIMDRASGVITINSKVGAEALTKGLPVISFGKAFYTEEGFSHHFSDWKLIAPILKKWASEKPKDQQPSSGWVDFLSRVWESSYPTELYDLTPKNVEDFSHSIQAALHLR